MDLDRFSVATFNLYNFQVPGAHMNPGQRPYDEQEYRRKVVWTADRLRDLRPEIVGFQELWHADALADVLVEANLDDDYDVLSAPATGDKIVCAAIVRKGLLRGDPQWISTFPDAVRLENTTGDPQAPDIAVHITGFSRPVLTFDVALREAPPLTKVFVTHLKSKLPAEISTEITRNIVLQSPVRLVASVRSTSAPSVVYPKRTSVTNAAWHGELQTRTGLALRNVVRQLRPLRRTRLRNAPRDAPPIRHPDYQTRLPVKRTHQRSPISSINIATQELPRL